MGQLTKSEIIHKRKKILFAFGCTFLFGSAIHATFDGFYAGASVGYLNQRTSLDAQQNPADPNADMNNTTAGRGLPTGEVFLGWGKVFGKNFYGGLEGKIDGVTGKSQKVAEDANFIYLSGRKGPGMAALARLGYLINPATMIYGGVGAKMARFEYNVFEKADKISALFSKQSLYLLTEIGVETSVGVLRNLKFRFSYSFMPARELTQNTTNFPVNHVYRTHGIIKSGVAENTFKAGIVYRF